MRKINMLSVAMLLTGTFVVSAQEQQPEKIKNINIYDIAVQVGYFSNPVSNGALADFKTLYPESTLLNNNLADFSESGDFSLINNTLFSVLLGFRFSDKQQERYKANPTLRLGVSYLSGKILQGDLYKTNRSAYDTLTSSQTSQTIYIDSVTTEYYSMNYASEQIRLDGSVIFRTNEKARLTLFAGIGLTTGISIHATTEVHYSKFYREEMRFPAGHYAYPYSFHYPGSNISKTETSRNKTHLVVSTYIPIGIDFRAGKKKEPWKRTHFFYEIRPSLNITSIPELRTVTHTHIQHGFGLRILCAS
jgi:hypothetical protein